MKDFLPGQFLAAGAGGASSRGEGRSTAGAPVPSTFNVTESLTCPIAMLSIALSPSHHHLLRDDCASVSPSMYSLPRGWSDPLTI